MHSASKYIIGVLGAVSITASLGYAPAQAAGSPKVKDVVLSVGIHATDRGISWLGSDSDAGYVQIVRIGTKHARSVRTGSQDFAKARTVKPSSSGVAGEQTGWEWNRAKLTGLKENSTYAYRICSAVNSCSQTNEFSTGKAGNFNFLAYGDPQVYLGTKTGQNAVVENPSAGWAQTLATSTNKFPNTAFLLTAGDQVDSYTVSKQASEWDAFLDPAQLTEYGIAPNVGNHDDASKAGYLYSQHFALPNLSTIGQSAAGTGDYYYTYNGVLFVSLNTNSLDFAGHETFLKQAIAANPKVRWRIVSFHQAPFSSADHPNDADVAAIRTNLTPILSKLGINLVINGHDHDYTRSYLMNGATAASTKAGKSQVAKTGQVLYLTLNSASGGKFYDLTGPYPWAAVTNQSLVANYTNVEVSKSSLTATTYEVGGRVVDRVILTRGK